MATFGALAPFSFHAVAVPAGAFTGDLYLLEERHGSLWLALGDVTGHGLEAAITAQMVQELLDASLAEDATPAALVAALHHTLLGELPVNRFASLVLGRLDPDGSLELVNAGHCPPLVVRSDGEVHAVGSHGPVLGVLPRSSWRSERFLLTPGDALVLYSDGIVEATSPAGRELGVEGLSASLATLAGEPPRALVGGALAAVEHYRQGAVAVDDVSLLAVGLDPRLAMPAVLPAPCLQACCA